MKKEEPELWSWFSSTKVRAEHADAVRLDLLKTTYRLESTSQPQVYEYANEVLDKLKIQAPVTLYQAQCPVGLNASLAYVPGEVHIILVGGVCHALSIAELKALLGHELAHFLLFDGWNGDFLCVSETLHALSNDAAVHPCHLETARLFRLYSKIFADRGALLVAGEPLVSIAALIKANTGLGEVSAEAYLREAEEILRNAEITANHATHPEPYVRTRALKLFADQGEAAGPEIERLIRGKPSLDQLDLLGQQKAAINTRRLLEQFLAPQWFRTESVLAHAKMFFSDFVPTESQEPEAPFLQELANADPSLQDYYCYVLLDFVVVDRDLEEAPLAAAILFCDRLGLAGRFAGIAARELGITKKRLAVIERDAANILQQANAASAT